MNFLERDWWLLLVRGIAAILFGAYALVDGVFGVVGGVRYRDRIANWGLWLLEGVLGIVVGALTLLMPGISAFVLLMFIAGWAIAGGILRIMAAIQLNKRIEGEWLLALSGALLVLFGLLLALAPGAVLLSLAWLVGAWAIVFGIVLAVLAFRLRRAGKDLSALAAARRGPFPSRQRSIPNV